MTAHVRVLSTQINLVPFIRPVLVISAALALILCAAWIAVRPATIRETSGPVVATWTEPDGETERYWVEIGGSGPPLRCVVAAYQTQLVSEWQLLRTGADAAMTCYGQTAVNLSATR